MTDKEAANITRQRTNPSIFDFCFITTRAHLKRFHQFGQMLQQQPQPISVLDLGCGQKPFQQLLTGVQIEKYVGVDFDTARSKPDIVAPVDDLPLADNSFDAIIATEVFEHTPNLEKAIGEMRRVARSGALAYISTPFIHGEHGTPYDFQRLTRYKYQDLFKNDEILLLRETNSNLATPFFVFNLAWENIAAWKMVPIIPAVIFLLNNLMALLGEVVVRLIGWLGKILFASRAEWFKKIFSIYFYSMPGGWDVIVRIQK